MNCIFAGSHTEQRCRCSKCISRVAVNTHVPITLDTYEIVFLTLCLLRVVTTARGAALKANDSFLLADLNDRPRWWELNSLSVYVVQSFNTMDDWPWWWEIKASQFIVFSLSIQLVRKGETFKTGPWVTWILKKKTAGGALQVVLHLAIVYYATVDGNALNATFAPNEIRSFLLYLWCSWTGDHPSYSLAKFGCKQDMKVENFNISSHFRLHARTQ